MYRSQIGHISTGFRRVASVLRGEPNREYVFRPRRRSDYWEGYRDGYADGHWAGSLFGRHPVVRTGFYYRHYFSDPAWLGLYHRRCYPSIYHYWGWCPGWVQPTRVYYEPVDYIHVPGGWDTSYRCPADCTGARGVVAEIRDAWLSNDIGSLARRARGDLGVHVDFDGEYAYSTSAVDYCTMTADIMATTQTLDITFDDPVWLSSHEVLYTGRQLLSDPDEDEQTVYVSYRLRNLDNDWYVVGVGSSTESLQYGYTDFRTGS
jgi:hypothetical protein